MIAEDAWLGAVLGRPVFRIDAGDAGEAGTTRAAALRDGVRAHARAQATALYYAKVDTAAIALARALGEAGLFVVDVNVTLDRAPSEAAAAEVDVADVRADQHAAVLDIAGRAFRYSRFHLDPLVPRGLADRTRREWIAGYLAGARGERLLVATVDGRPAGFLAVLVSEVGGKVARVIDLVAVAPEAQGRGVGTALVTAFVREASPNSDVLRVGTQIANAPSLRLYTRLGFRIAASAFVMHLHVGPAMTDPA